MLAGPAGMLLNRVAPAVVPIWFWLRRQGMPGKLALLLRVVDQRAGQSLTVGQSIGRYFAYFASTIPFGPGFRAKGENGQPVAFDKA